MAAPGGRVANTEIVVPVVVGTVSFFLGKKANEYASHKWTVYVRGPHGEDLSHVVAKVTFTLHASFPNPMRVVTAPPFELTETGWGEFEIGVALTLAEDSGERDVELTHRLKLYADDDAQGTSRKAVVSETVEELVFSQPMAAFAARMQAHQPRPRVPLSVEQHLTPPSEAAELAAVQEARRKVAQMAAALRLQLQQPVGLAAPFDPTMAMTMGGGSGGGGVAGAGGAGGGVMPAAAAAMPAGAGGGGGAMPMAMG